MDPKYTRILKVLPTANWVVVEITGPELEDVKTKVVETRKLPSQTIRLFQSEAN